MILWFSILRFFLAAFELNSASATNLPLAFSLHMTNLFCDWCNQITLKIKVSPGKLSV
jgi:hypothetical protein